MLRFLNVVSIFQQRRKLEMPPRILFVTEGQTACSELVTAPLAALHAQGKIRFTVAFEHDYPGAQLRRLARTACDLLMVFRASTRRGLRTFQAAKRAGKRTVWASDDDLLSLDASNPVGSRYQRPKVRNSINTMMKNADGLWVFSSAMADKYRSMGFQTIYDCRSLAPLREAALKPESASDVHADCIRIGHIGDYSHANEMHHLVRAIQSLTAMKLEREWKIDFVGYTPEELTGHPRVRSIPYITGIDAFHQWLGTADWSIGIAPLRDTPFNRCKTDNKFRTFSAFGIAGVYSNIPPYSDSVSHGQTGMLCADDSEAYAQTLAKLIENDSLRNRIQTNAKQVCHERYSQDAVEAQYTAILCNLLNLPGLTQTPVECYPTHCGSYLRAIGA